MIRMTSGTKNLGTGRVMLDQYQKNKAASEEEDAGIEKVVQDRYEKHKAKAANEDKNAKLGKLMMDRYEKGRTSASTVYAYNAAGVASRDFGGSQLFRAVF